LPGSWILQANPKRWNVFDWWDETSEELEHWTISSRLDQISAGDNFALWVGGRHAGIYALGTVDSAPYGPFVVDPDGDYWEDPPTEPTYGVWLKTTRYLFDRPILKAELAADPDFAKALILRMPGGPNPFPLRPREWRAIRSRVRGSRGTASHATSGPTVTSRPLGEAPESITIPDRAQEQYREYREAQMVKRYEKSVGRLLMSKSITLPSGERLACDIVDDQQGLLIEAKSSASRQDVRMAIGQLLDYRRHLAPKAKLAVLVPERPSDDLLTLLGSLGIDALVEGRRGQFAVA
jgi:hypothetical protein